jgi:hypothetical protein
MSLGTIISSGIWRARSPDINPCDFFFWNWSCLKDKVYSSNPQTEELEENILREIANIPAEQLLRINQTLIRHYEECVHVEGQRLQHLL